MTECTDIKLNSDGSIARSTAPENVGVNSATVIKMLDSLESKGFQYHSLMIVRHGMVAAECYRYPFCKDTAHTMYSVSKSVTSTAVGFAVAEKLLSLDTRIIDIFPEYRKKNEKNDYIDKLTVKHLLSMMSGKLPSPLLNKTDDDWLKHLFDAKWAFEPGAQFAYVNENMFALCAALQRITGMSVVDYLMPRLFEPLGIKRPVWETDSHGVEAGGWGIFLTTEDLAKLMLCYHYGGKWAGKQVIPSQWSREATLNQHGKTPPVREGGYGYGIWVRNENEYYAGGMFTQMSYIFENEDCAAVVTACSPTETPFYAALDMLKNEGFITPDETAAADEAFFKNLNERKLDIVPFTGIRSNIESNIASKTIRFKKNLILNLIGFPVSVLHLAAVYMSNYRAGNIDKVRFDFYDDSLVFSWSEGDEHNSVSCPMNGEYAFTPVTLAHIGYTAAACAFWSDEHTLDVWIRPLESLCCRKLKFTFTDNGKVRMKPTSSPCVNDIIASVSDEIHSMIKFKRLDFLADIVLKRITKHIEPVHKGRIKTDSLQSLFCRNKSRRKHNGQG